MRLRKLHADYDPTQRRAAMNHLAAMQDEGEIPTGLLYVNPDAQDLHRALNTVARPLNMLAESDLCPGADALSRINASLR